jgi:hypothetical protein
MTAPVVTTLTVVKIGVAADPRLVFLQRVSARLVLVEAGEMDLDGAIRELIEPFEELVGPLRSACTRDIIARWERRYPPIRRKPRR